MFPLVASLVDASHIAPPYHLQASKRNTRHKATNFVKGMLFEAALVASGFLVRERQPTFLHEGDDDGHGVFSYSMKFKELCFAGGGELFKGGYSGVVECSLCWFGKFWQEIVEGHRWCS